MCACEGLALCGRCVGGVVEWHCVPFSAVKVLVAMFVDFRWASGSQSNFD